jgi:hypothetical protein
MNQADPEHTDLKAGFEIGSDFERFEQKNDVFRRACWNVHIQRMLLQV